MNILKYLFTPNKIKKKASIQTDDRIEKPKAFVYIDFEHWYYSLKRLYKCRPDVVEWKQKIEKKYNLKSINVFADFSESDIKYEVQPLRQITNKIIETQNMTKCGKKDMTDFVMLDAIYQSVDDPNSPSTYIVFTGDGHFQSVVSYLINCKGKKVIVYGVRQATNRQLAAVASECIQIPAENEFSEQHIKMIFSDLYSLSENQSGLIFPTYLKTVEIISRKNSANPDAIKAALSNLISKGYIRSDIVRPRKNVEFRALFVNWDRVYEDEVWTSEK